jgi:hypothetical protein
MTGLRHLLLSDRHSDISSFGAYGCDTRRLHMKVRYGRGSDQRTGLLAYISAGNMDQEITAVEELLRNAEVGENTTGIEHMLPAISGITKIYLSGIKGVLACISI